MIRVLGRQLRPGTLIYLVRKVYDAKLIPANTAFTCLGKVSPELYLSHLNLKQEFNTSILGANFTMFFFNLKRWHTDTERKKVINFANLAPLDVRCFLSFTFYKMTCSIS